MRALAPSLVLAVALGACSSVSNTGVLGLDASTTDTPRPSDNGASVDTAPQPDVSPAIDVPPATDVPPTTDVPLAMDVPPTIDVPPALDAPSPADVSTATDAGSILPPRDAGPLPLDGGSLGDPAWVSLDVRVGGTCPALTACGGAIQGAWDVSGGCVEVPLPSQLSLCPGARVTRSSGRARGRVVFGPVIARRASQWEVETELFIPQLCATVVGGCAVIEGYVRPLFPDSRCVTEGSGDCRCAARQSGTIDDGDAYTTTSTQIVSTSSGKRWDYCVEGDRIRYNDASPGGVREPGPIELTRRSP
ncbi:MAG: hypothetical protein R3A52_02315 [Polyangiales bacterium]